jgi:hypothetical protein
MKRSQNVDDVQISDLSILIPDNRNFNLHTEYGMSVLEKSIRQNKFGRSVLVDRNNRIIAGNGVVETASAIGETKIKIVETTGEELVVVKRTDVDLDSKQGREMALADNSVASADLKWNEDEIKKAEQDFQINAAEWGLTFEEEAAKAEGEMNNAGREHKFLLQIEFTSEEAMREIYQELLQRGYDVNIEDMG